MPLGVAWARSLTHDRGALTEQLHFWSDKRAAFVGAQNLKPAPPNCSVLYCSRASLRQENSSKSVKLVLALLFSGWTARLAALELRTKAGSYARELP